MDEADWMSISSDEGGKTTKVIHVHEGNPKGQPKKKSKKEKTTMSPDEIKAMRAENAKLSKSCKKCRVGWNPC